MRNARKPSVSARDTASDICRELRWCGGGGNVDRWRPAVNVPATVSPGDLRLRIESGAVGPVLVWQGRRLLGLIDRARLA